MLVIAVISVSHNIDELSSLQSTTHNSHNNRFYQKWWDNYMYIVLFTYLIVQQIQIAKSNKVLCLIIMIWLKREECLLTIRPICALAGWCRSKCFLGGTISWSTSLWGSITAVTVIFLASAITLNPCIACQNREKKHLNLDLIVIFETASDVECVLMVTTLRFGRVMWHGCIAQD